MGGRDGAPYPWSRMVAGAVVVPDQRETLPLGSHRGAVRRGCWARPDTPVRNRVSQWVDGSGDDAAGAR